MCKNREKSSMTNCILSLRRTFARSYLGGTGRQVAGCRWSVQKGMGGSSGEKGSRTQGGCFVLKSS